MKNLLLVGLLLLGMDSAWAAQEISADIGKNEILFGLSGVSTTYAGVPGNVGGNLQYIRHMSPAWGIGGAINAYSYNTPVGEVTFGTFTVMTQAYLQNGLFYGGSAGFASSSNETTNVRGQEGIFGAQGGYKYRMGAWAATLEADLNYLIRSSALLAQVAATVSFSF